LTALSTVAGDQADLGPILGFQVVDELDAVTVRQLQVGKQHVRPHLGELDARGAQRCRFRDRETFGFDEFRQPFQLFGIVVAEQYVWHQTSLYTLGARTWTAKAGKRT
jgi:hypothetical protein